MKKSKKSYKPNGSTTKNINQCTKCKVEADCAANSWCLFDPYNKKCPNRKTGLKQLKEFLKDYNNYRETY